MACLPGQTDSGVYRMDATNKQRVEYIQVRPLGMNGVVITTPMITVVAISWSFLERMDNDATVSFSISAGRVTVFCTDPTPVLVSITITGE